MCLPAFICLSVCLLTRLLKNACMDLDEMLRVDRCRYMDELINFWGRSGCQNRIAFSDIVCAATQNFITLGKPHIQVLGTHRYMTKATLTLFGHIMRMDDNADAMRILLASPPADRRRQPGRPRITWLSTVRQDLKHHHLTLPEAADLAQNHPQWRTMSTYGATQS